MIQDLRKMTASQRSKTHGHVVDPLPNVPALVISLFPAHDMTKLFKLTIKLPPRNGRSAYCISAIEAICIMRNGGKRTWGGRGHTDVAGLSWDMNNVLWTA